MDLTGIGLFSLAEQRLAWVDKRQQLLAQNIANADTPGFQPRDLAPFAGELARAVSPARTSPLHLSGFTTGGMGAAQVLPRERAPDGNAVSVDDELTKVADTDSTHELVTNIYRKYIDMFRATLGKS